MSHSYGGELIIWLLRFGVVAGFASIALFVWFYTRWTEAGWHRHSLSFTIMVKDLLIAALLVPSSLSLFFGLNRLDSLIAAWADTVLIGLIAPVMVWRTVAWHRYVRRAIEGESEDEDMEHAHTGVAAHTQQVTHSYLMHYPEHPARQDDPHYKDFEEYRSRTHATAKCAIGEHRGDFSECQGELELHHAHIEFALQNGVDLAWLEKDYPGVSSPDEVGAWVESASNLTWLCVFHHRGHGGVHVTSASDFEAERYVRGLVS